MASVRIRYLQEQDGALHYRRRVPDDLKARLGRKEWKHALGLSKGQEGLAVRLVQEYDAAYAQLIARERINQLTGEIWMPQAQVKTTPEPQSEQRAKPILLSRAYAYDRESYGGSRDEKPFSIAVASVEDALGDADLLTLTPKDVQSWVRACLDKGQKAATVQRRVNAVRALVGRYFRDHEIERNNPFAKLGIKSEESAKTDRLPFHRSHLLRIDHYVANHQSLKPETRCLMTILKYTGARPLEIGGLDAADMLLDHDVPHLWLRNNPHRRLKTKGSERRIPLIGEALEAAREVRGNVANGAVFPVQCHNTNSLSQRLNKVLRGARIPKSPRLVIYSFRHTLEEAMRTAGVREHTQKRILGHTDNSMTGRYGAPAGLLEELQSAIRSSIPVLGKVDLSIYHDQERVDLS